MTSAAIADDADADADDDDPDDDEVEVRTGTYAGTPLIASAAAEAGEVAAAAGVTTSALCCLCTTPSSSICQISFMRALPKGAGTSCSVVTCHTQLRNAASSCSDGHSISLNGRFTTVSVIVYG
jgi:hypothetical protein